jgi:hypothetical protein
VADVALTLVVGAAVRTAPGAQQAATHQSRKDRPCSALRLLLFAANASHTRLEWQRCSSVWRFSNNFKISINSGFATFEW